jgi:hypothetical protein
MLPSPHTRLVQAQATWFSYLICNYAWGKTRFARGYAGNYRDVLQIPSYSGMDKLIGELRCDPQLLRSAVPLGYPDFVHNEDQIVGADGFIDEESRNFQTRFFFWPTSRLNQF